MASLRSDPILRFTLVRGARPSAKSSCTAGHERRMRRVVATGFASAVSTRSSSPSLRRRLSCEQLPRAGHGGRCPGRRADLRWVGDGVEERGEGGHAGDAIGDGVMHLDEEPDPVVRQAGQEPHLPQGPAPVQWTAPEPLAGEEELQLVARGRHRVDADVFGDVEGLGIAPHRPPQTASGPVQGLAEPWDKVQPVTHGFADRLDPKLTVGVDHRPALEDGEGPDHLRPALLLRPDQHQIRCGHPIERAAAFGGSWIGSLLHSVRCRLLRTNSARHDCDSGGGMALPGQRRMRSSTSSTDSSVWTTNAITAPSDPLTGRGECSVNVAGAGGPVVVSSLSPSVGGVGACLLVIRLRVGNGG